MNLRTLFIILIGLNFLSCDNKDEQLPSFLDIKQFTVAENIDAPFNIGSLSQKITHARVFIEDAGNTTAQSDDLGVISLPANIPYLGSGEKFIRIIPIVRANGSSFTLRIYPFYQEYSVTTILTELEETTIQPITKYKNTQDFDVHFNESFSGSNHIFSNYRTGEQDSFMTAETGAFEGGKSGRIVLDENNPAVEITTISAYNVSSSLSPYLEFNYKTEVPIEIGIIGISAAGESPLYEVILNSNDEWNKIYIELLEQVGFLSNQGFNNYLISFRVALPFENGAFINEERTVLIDNFKFLSF